MSTGVFRRRSTIYEQRPPYPPSLIQKAVYAGPAAAAVYTWAAQPAGLRSPTTRLAAAVASYSWAAQPVGMVPVSLGQMTWSGAFMTWGGEPMVWGPGPAIYTLNADAAVYAWSAMPAQLTAVLALPDQIIDGEWLSSPIILGTAGGVVVQEVT